MNKVGNLSFSSELHAVVHRAKRPGLMWRVRNLPHLVKGDVKWGIARTFGIFTAKGELYATIRRANGTVENYGRISSRVVTTAFVNALAANMVNNATAPLIDSYDYHASGTGTTAEAVGQTALVTDSGIARVAGTPTNPTANQYQTVATQAYTGTLAITEHAVFSAATVGTMLDRSVFAALNVGAGDSIQWTYILTINAGG